MSIINYQFSIIFYPVGYNVEGGLLVMKPDSSIEFNVRDHIGNVRATYSFKQGVMQYRNYDYKPFGDTLWTSGAAENGWKGFNGESKDLESDYMNMGARIYDPSIGRFSSVDPLFEAFPKNSPLEGWHHVVMTGWMY
ncbi:MAG: hypothetical protein A2X64_02095 [Ignavibacteria bacterium GWF2_33_9]|nr:MAG: hypothetical protein A2X64_02095 [Ignavibacteria bacterium GWF2_33_9]